MITWLQILLQMGKNTFQMEHFETERKKNTKPWDKSVTFHILFTYKVASFFIPCKEPSSGIGSRFVISRLSITFYLPLISFPIAFAACRHTSRRTLPNPIAFTESFLLPIQMKKNRASNTNHITNRYCRSQRRQLSLPRWQLSSLPLPLILCDFYYLLLTANDLHIHLIILIRGT